MARVPVDRKGEGKSWWFWLVALLVLAGLVWALAVLFDVGPEEEDVVGFDVDTLTYDQRGNGPITDLSTILASPSQEALAGRDVELSNVRVTRVVGGSAFYVAQEGAATGAELFVALDEEEPASPPDVDSRSDVEGEQAFPIREGQLVSLDGVLQEMTEADRQNWNLTEEDVAGVRANQVFLRAQRLQIASASEDGLAINTR